MDVAELLAQRLHVLLRAPGSDETAHGDPTLDHRTATDDDAMLLNEDDPPDARGAEPSVHGFAELADTSGLTQQLLRKAMCGGFGSTRRWQLVSQALHLVSALRCQHDLAPFYERLLAARLLHGRSTSVTVRCGVAACDRGGSRVDRAHVEAGVSRPMCSLSALSQRCCVRRTTISTPYSPTRRPCTESETLPSRLLRLL